MGKTTGMLNGIWLCCIFCFSSFSVKANDFKHECLKSFMAVEKPFENFSPDEWVVEALFFDLDGDGKTEEAFLAAPDQRYADGNLWVAMRKNALADRLECHPAVGESGLDLFSHPSKLYVVSCSGTGDRLYGNDVTIYDIRNYGTRNNKQNIYRDDVLIEMDTNGFLRAISVKDGFSGLVSERGFKRLSRAVTELYKGEDMRLVRSSGIAPDISDSRPNGFGKFAAKYRGEIKRRLGIDHKVTLFAVFFDADNDGDVDFYVSSDVEVGSGGQFEWHLYLNCGGKFIRADKPVWFNADKGYSRESIQPDETASMNSFYRVQRDNGFAPSIIILDRNGREMHSRTAIRQALSPRPTPPSKHLSRDQERDYYRNVEEWEWEQKQKIGFIPAYDFNELVARCEFLRMELLECDAFPED